MKNKEKFMLVPQGDPANWQSFRASSYELVWTNGKIGRKRFERIPSETEKKLLLESINIALISIEAYKKELEDAKKALE
jgi:hypothetical protein